MWTSHAASGAAMHCTYCKGSTVFQFHASDAGDHTTTYWNLAQEEGLSFKSNYREKLERYAVSENQRTMTLLLGAAAVLLVLVILLFILSDMAEQERRRIGILRAIGASKRDISRVFNAETLIEGLIAGLIGIGLTLVLIIPINAIVRHLTGIAALGAALPAAAGAVLIAISMLLTFIAGLIPSRIAAKKDPVVALRSE